MGVFSKHIRYREAGQQANVNNVARFGEPARSLFTSTKVFTLHHHIDITDENETVIVTRKDEKNVVIISLEQYNSMMKAAHNAEYLAKAEMRK